MAKESTFKNMVVTLLTITLLSAAALGAVYALTKDTIEQGQVKKVNDAIARVVPKFDNNPSAEVITKFMDGDTIRLFPAKKDGKLVGMAIETFTKNGFSGLIKLMVGFKANGTIYDIAVISHNETPGLGDKIEKDKSNFSVQFEGIDPSTTKIAVTKDGGAIDAITASTISSRAYCEAVNRAYKVFREEVFGETIENNEVSIEDIITQVAPEFNNTPVNETFSVPTDGDTVKLYVARKNNDVTGIVVETFSKKGYKGLMRFMVGFRTDGTINKTVVLSHNETPGIGDKVEENNFTNQFEGKNPSKNKIAVTQDGGVIDGISGSTVSSRAYCDAINRAYKAFVELTTGDTSWTWDGASSTDAVSGATTNTDASTGATSQPAQQPDGNSGATSTTTESDGASGSTTPVTDTTKKN